MSDKKLILFDLDNTLVDFMSDYFIALKEFSETKGLPYDFEKISQGYTHPKENDLGWGIPLEQQEELLMEMCWYYWDQLSDHNRFMPAIYPNVQETLEVLSKDYDLGIVTSRDRRSFLVVLEHYKLDKFFPVYRTYSCAMERGYPIKPAPDPIYCVIKETGHKPENIIMIGDTSADVQMAHAAGVKSIAALWDSASPEKVKLANPTMVLHHITDLPQAIKKVFEYV